MQIPKQVSGPADPKEPSFLSLPAEIRNWIYELLFTRDEPVLLHNAKAYHATLPEDLYTPFYGFNRRQQLIDYFDDSYEDEIVQGGIFVHDFQTVTPALLVCRQVYAEAAGYLYGNNTFMFSRPLYHHDSRDGDEYYVEEDDESYFVTSYGAQWLQNLGSQLELLNKVRVDVGALCPRSCIQSMGFIPVLKLVRVLWRYPYLADVVAFTQREPTKREMNDFGRSNHSEDEYTMEFEEYAKRLQKILFTIGVQDVLNSRRYASLDLLVTDINLASSLDYGHVTGPNLVLKFETPEDGAVRWLEKSETPLSPLKDLDLPLMRKIFSLVTFPADQIILDLDQRKFRGFSPVILHLNSKFRHLPYDRIPKDISILIRKSISTTTFDLIGAVRPIGPGGEHSGIWHASLRGLFNNSSIGIVLDFNIATATSLKEIRINIKNAVPELIHSYFFSKAKLLFCLKCPWGNAIHHEEVTIRVVELVQNLFLLLSDIKQQWPSEIDKTGDKQLPDIWLSGNGVLISASYPATSHSSERRIEYAHGRLTPTEIRNRGYRMAMTTDPTWDLGRHVGMLGECWDHIRCHHYHDRDWKRV
ncbi:hypothetical protein AA0111_g10515 [Alternaria arborescens]|uniref:hypothetical protein n=1 Tax=Alternaria arborescens TaxID=156630 RepID=UPI00107571F7|nr:hypothetical protein AA0111_g10515 [Alternaria arborescens]RYO19150.1 hypothetical protein AA0111_g10515 [Alternaria arborescens]